MSGFTALNVEAEDQLEEDVDDTKEIQLEEAFKLYQNALKLQSQGPECYIEASEAYRQLFQSEVFKYPEVISEYAHDQLENHLEPSTGQDDLQAIAVPASGPDSSANSLLQLVYLAHKNRGEFILNDTRAQAHQDGAMVLNNAGQWKEAADETLKHFANALEFDDTDIDLWKKAARVAEILASQRVLRFCLESALVGDDDVGESMDISGLDEAYSVDELKAVITSLCDDLSSDKLQYIQPRQVLRQLLRKRNDPYPFLPARRPAIDYTDDRARPINFQPVRHTMRPAKCTWNSLAQAILQALTGEQSNTLDFGPGGAILVEFPDVVVPGTATDNARLSKELRSGLSDASTAPEEKSNIFGAVVESPQKEQENPLESAVENSGDGTIVTKPITTSEELDLRAPLHSELVAATDAEDLGVAEDQATTVMLPTRKRSATAAGNDEPGTGTRSKRLRARESMVDGVTLEDDSGPAYAQSHQDQLELYNIADQWMFNTVNDLHSKLGIAEMGTFEDTKQKFDETASVNSSAVQNLDIQCDGGSLLQDLKHALLTWSDDKTQALSTGQGNHNLGGGNAGLMLFLQHSKTSLSLDCDQHAPETDPKLFALTNQVNTQWSSIHDIAVLFLQSLLCTDDTGESAYMKAKWSDDLKQSVVQMIVREDEQLYSSVHHAFWKASSAGVGNKVPAVVPRETLELAEALFELHLDVYCSVTNPSSRVDVATRTQQQDRLVRWAELASLMVDTSTSHYESSDSLLLRYVFAAATYGNKAEEDRHDHVNACLHDLRSLLESVGSPTILLPNNAAMPEVSVGAVDQEMSRLSTLEFFTNIFEADDSDAVGTIESLEPILYSTLPNASEVHMQDGHLGSVLPAQREKLLAFLDSGDASLKLFLWRRLQNAYQSISYTPMVVSCQLRAIETIMLDLESRRHKDMTTPRRQVALLKSLRAADDLVALVVTRAVSEAKAFECLDTGHLCSTISMIARLSRLLHGFVLFEDSVRLNNLVGPSFKSVSLGKAFEKSKERFREMLVRVWTLHYLLLEEATLQFAELFKTPADDIASFLRSVHNALGIRQYCKYANRIFLKQMKTALLPVSADEGYSTDIAQVLFDLHGLKFSPGLGDADHGCPHEELDQPTAMQLVPMVMLQANRFSIKDFSKSELRSNIDKVQKALGSPKYMPGSAVQYNRKVIRTYLQSPIDPKALYQCVKGVGDVPTRPVRDEYSDIADHGWYFLQGHLALAKFKSVKRVNPTGTDELDIASSFFLQDLEHGPEKWETWYRLAQAFEAKIEDDLIWNSTKLNDSRSDIATLERKSVHAFCMAVATATRSADLSNPETAQKINDLFTEFGSRIYASSREPLSMEAFKTDKSVRHFSRETDQVMYKGPSIKPMSAYSAWSFAAGLLRRNLSDKPKHWTSYYVLTKCLWKMLCYEMDRADASFDRKKATHIVLAAATTAIESVPPKSEKASDYILEPHFKLVSLLHKMVCRSLLSPEEAVAWLCVTPHASTVKISNDESGKPHWKQYILAVLEKLKKADKSNWHHRIVARSAHIIFDNRKTYEGALGAKQEFTQQIFTKTMTLQVWKPEFERPGRHYVYTGRYVLFFVKLLGMLDDRSNLDLLLRRMRRKPTDFLNHTEIWEETVITYVRVLRRVANIPEGHEKMIFHEALSHEEFEACSQKLERWAQETRTPDKVLEVLRDAMELKKLNNSLMKGTMVDDLAQDAYATLYEEHVAEFSEGETAESKANATQSPPLPQQPQEPLGGFVTKNALRDGTHLPDGRMSVGNLLLHTDVSDQVDGPANIRPVGLGLQHGPFGTQNTARTSSNNAPNIPSSETTGALQQHRPSGLAPTSLGPRPGGRVKNITKAELKRKIEALLVKPPPIKTPVLSKKPIVEIEEATTSKERAERVARDVEATIDKSDAVKHDRLDEVSNNGGQEQSPEPSDEADAEDVDVDVDLAEADGDADNEGGESDNGSELSDDGEVDGDGEERDEDEDEDDLEAADGRADHSDSTAPQRQPRSLFPGIMSRMGGLFGGFGRRTAEESIGAGAQTAVSSHPEYRDQEDGVEMEIEDSQEK